MEVSIERKVVSKVRKPHSFAIYIVRKSRIGQWLKNTFYFFIVWVTTTWKLAASNVSLEKKSLMRE